MRDSIVLRLDGRDGCDDTAGAIGRETPIGREA